MRKFRSFYLYCRTVNLKLCDDSDALDSSLTIYLSESTITDSCRAVSYACKCVYSPHTVIPLSRDLLPKEYVRQYFIKFFAKSVTKQIPLDTFIRLIFRTILVWSRKLISQYFLFRNREFGCIYYYCLISSYFRSNCW